MMMAMAGASVGKEDAFAMTRQSVRANCGDGYKG